MGPSGSTKFFYGFGSIAYGVVDNGFSYFLLFFYSAVVGLPPALTGLALMVALIFDALSDPIVGQVSDNLHSKWGRRHPFMYASIIPIAIAYLLLWQPPAFLWHPSDTASEWALFGYLVFITVVIRTCVTLYEVPSSSLVAEFTQDYDQRTVLLGYRYFFGWMGGLAIAILTYGWFLRTTPEYPQGTLNPEGYLYLAIASVVFITSAILVSTLGTHKEIPNLRKPPPKRPFSLKQTAQEVFDTLSTQSFVALFLAAIISAMAAGIGASLYIYIMTYFWGLSSLQLFLIICGHVPAVALALIVAPRIAKGRNKKFLAIGLSVFSALYLPFLVVLGLLGWFLPPDHPYFFPLIMLHMNSEVAILVAIGTLISSMVADVVEESELRTGRRSEGLFFAARSFAAKMTNGLGLFVGGLIVSVAGVTARTGGAPVDPGAATTLAILYVPILSITYLAAVSMLSFYRIDRTGHTRNLAELAAVAEREQTGV